jgi:hypothetical protein
VSESLRIIFAGTPDFAARHLDALLSSEHQIVGVFTQPDRPAGRGKKLMPSPVKVLAEERDSGISASVSSSTGKSTARCRFEGRCHGGCRLRPHSAKSGSGYASSGLYQRTRFFAPALAWCGTDPAFPVGG